jgi:hypothetical protein
VSQPFNRPSSLFRRRLCPGSARMEAGLPEETSEPAERGRLLHAWAAHFLAPTKQPQPATPMDAAGKAMVDAYVSAVWNQKPPRPGAELVVEHRVNLDHLGMPDGGTVDAAWIVPALEAVVLDLKTGWGYVDPPQHSDQAKAYVSGVAHDFGTPKVTFGFVQDQAGDPRFAVFGPTEIDEIDRLLSAVVSATLPVDAPLVPGEKQCANCKARHACPARNGAVVATQEAYGELTSAAIVRAMTPAERGAWWARIIEARKRLQDIERLFHDTAVAEGLAVDGYRIGEGKRGYRVWTDAAQALARGRMLALETGKDPDDLAEQRVRSPAEFDKILGKSARVRQALDPITTQPPGNQTLLQNTREQ